jgi:hypothetical protein
MCEQLILYGYSLCILDPEGDYTSLEALPGVVVLGGADPLPKTRDLMRALRHADVSIVIDLSHTSSAAKLEYLRNILPALATLRRHTGLPHGIVVDEAHYFLHDPDVRDLLDLERNGYTLVTYRASRLHPDVLAASHAVIVTRESDPHEVEALRALCGSCKNGTSENEWKQLLGNLMIGEAVALPITDEAEGKVRRIRLAPRLTPHIRHFAKYIDIPVSEARAFVFWDGNSPTGRRARTLRKFVDVVEGSPPPALDGHLRRGDFSNWIAEVFGDYPLANNLKQLEEKYRSNGVADVATGLCKRFVRVTNSLTRRQYQLSEKARRVPLPVSTASRLHTRYREEASDKRQLAQLAVRGFGHPLLSDRTPASDYWGLDSFRIRRKEQPWFSTRTPPDLWLARQPWSRRLPPDHSIGFCCRRLSPALAIPRPYSSGDSSYLEPSPDTDGHAHWSLHSCSAVRHQPRESPVATEPLGIAVTVPCNLNRVFSID